MRELSRFERSCVQGVGPIPCGLSDPLHVEKFECGSLSFYVASGMAPAAGFDSVRRYCAWSAEGLVVGGSLLLGPRIGLRDLVILDVGLSNSLHVIRVGTDLLVKFGPLSGRLIRRGWSAELFDGHGELIAVFPSFRRCIYMVPDALRDATVATVVLAIIGSRLSHYVQPLGVQRWHILGEYS